MTEKILQGPIGIVIGIAYGCIFALTLLYVPSNKSVS